MPHPRPPGPEVLRPFHRRDVAAGDIEVPRGPERGMHRVREQLVDLLRPFVRGAIAEEGADFLAATAGCR